MDLPICFVAMPAGRQEPERLFYLAWYSLVFKPAIADAGYAPYLQLAQTAPIHISREIRRQLVEAPMALFDLAGVTQEDSPNPNVMYELGIRHAFGKPAVLYSWGHPPFDVAEQHALLGPREVSHIDRLKTDIVQAIQYAAAGQFFNPMAGVQLATLAQSVATGDDRLKPIVDVLLQLQVDQGAIATELSNMRSALERRTGLPSGSLSPLSLLVGDSSQYFRGFNFLEDGQEEGSSLKFGGRPPTSRVEPTDPGQGKDK